MTKKFRLQPVLKYRELVEDQHRQKLADSLRHHQAAQVELSDHRDRARELNSEFDNRQQEGIDVQDLLLYTAGIEHQRRKVQRLEAREETLRLETHERRQGLKTASLDRKLIDNLKEKLQREERMEQDRQEGLLMDELAVKTGREGL